MTTVGKILAIIHLLFGLGVGALCVFLYANRVNWAEYAHKIETKYNAAEADYKAVKKDNEDLTKAKEDKDNKLKKAANANATEDPTTKVTSTIEGQTDKIKALTARLDEMDKALVMANQKNAEFDAIVKADQLALRQQQDQATFLKKELDEARTKNAELRTDIAKARMDKAKAETELFAARDRMTQVEGQFRELISEITRLKGVVASGGAASTTTVLSPNTPNPPAFAVEGKVKQADGGLVEITVGSDAGLVRGHTLDVFRTVPKPQYLGRIRLVTVEPHRSVGQVVGKTTSPVQIGDTVASKIVAGN